jgi:ferredoxin/flavodoxin---NADP+ reductase
MNRQLAIGGAAELERSELHELRNKHYNATVAEIREVHADLRILRVVPDTGLPHFLAGQYISLGLGNWEPRVPGVDEEQLDPLHAQRLARRAYSISCSILDDEYQLRRAEDFPYLEFYVALVRHAVKRPPALTPRLFALRQGDRLFVEQHAAGQYTLQPLPPEDDVFFFSTGTGEAPHNSMIAELLASGHRGRIVSVLSVRLWRDAAYSSIHEELTRRYSNYHYRVLTTREPENLDVSRANYGGKPYLQDLVRTGRLERETGVSLDPLHAHVFLCGNPTMIGISRKSAASGRVAEPESMLDLLLARGFRPDRPHLPGTVHFERYW